MQKHRIAITASALMAMSAQAAEASPLPLIACPIVQDTPNVPCWIVESGGETYYLGIQTDVSAPFNPPALGHKVLVEGEVKPGGERICGGLVVEPVTVSVMPELSPECNELRMVDPRYVLPFEPPRPPGPSGGQLAFANPPPPSTPQPPFTAQSFTVPYEFDGMVNFKTPRSLTPVLRFVRDTNASRIEITGYRGAMKLADGTVISEKDGIALKRAQEIAHMLRGAGLDQAEYVVKGNERRVVGGPENRRTVIRVVP
jgi:hypothetical protein